MQHQCQALILWVGANCQIAKQMDCRLIWKPKRSEQEVEEKESNFAATKRLSCKNKLKRERDFGCLNWRLIFHSKFTVEASCAKLKLTKHTNRHSATEKPKTLVVQRSAHLMRVSKSSLCASCARKRCAWQQLDQGMAPNCSLQTNSLSHSLPLLLL